MSLRRYHPGTCTATEWGNRYGKFSEPQRYDDKYHQWNLAKSTNWGNWSCCGGAANSDPCTVRPSSVDIKSSTSDEKVNLADSKKGELKSTAPVDIVAQGVDKKRHVKEGVGAQIHFLGKGDNVVVIGDGRKCWRLENGRIAKKKTHGTVWLWLDEFKNNAL